MRAHRVVILHVTFEDTAQVLLACHHDVVQAFPADRAIRRSAYPFCQGVQKSDDRECRASECGERQGQGAGVEKAIRSLRGGIESPILRLNYQRNTVDVEDAVAKLQQGNAQLQQKRHPPIKAVIMVPAYRAAAKFIEKTRDLYPDMIYTSVSFVGSTALADELMLLGKKYATGVIVTQVVPAVDGHSSLVLDYKSALAKYFPGDAPDYVSLEGYVDATALIAALQRNGPELDTERLVGTLENLRDLDLGLGTSVTFSRSDHQGVHKVWGTQLDETGHYQPIDLQ
jgi:branched-chain amino acid transport system substrate-binding protein